MAKLVTRVNGSRLAALQEERLSRGIDLYLRGKIRFPYRGRGDGLKVGKTLFGVLSDSRPDLMHFVERPDEGSRWVCDCEDFQKRGERLACKHICAVLYWLGQVSCPFCGRKVEGLYTTCEPCRRAADAAQAEADAAYYRAADLENLLFG
jgi:hypothetical protein